MYEFFFNLQSSAHVHSVFFSWVVSVSFWVEK